MSPLAFSLFKRSSDSYVFAYKLLGRTKPGPALVLVHGLSAVGLVDWLPLARHLAEYRPVLIFDNRGIGSSEIPKEHLRDGYTVQDMASDVVDLIKHNGLREIDILGFSMGGMIVQTLLLTPNLPFKVRHAILAATSAKPAHSDLLGAIPSAPSGPLNLEQKMALVRPFIEIGYDPSFLRQPRNQAILDQRTLESAQTRRPARTVQHQVGVIAGYDVRKRLSSIPSTLPVLVIHGTLDRSVYFSESKYILSGIKHAQLLTFEGMGHMWYDYLDSIYWTNLINRFLRDQEVAFLVPLTLEHPIAKL